MAKKEAIVEKKEKTNINVQEGVKVEKVLIENFVSLQKVMTNLAVKFDNLSSQISKLLELFEISAKALAEKGTLGEERTDKKAAEKLDSLLEQNKIIAKGIALLHEKNPLEEPRYTIPNQTRFPMQQMPQQRLPYDFSKNPRIGK
jgi:hypothetical protein